MVAEIVNIIYLIYFFFRVHDWIGFGGHCHVIEWGYVCVCILGLPTSSRSIWNSLEEKTSQLLRSYTWPLLGKIAGSLQAVSVFVSTLSITAIDLNRHQLIVYTLPRKVFRWRAPIAGNDRHLSPRRRPGPSSLRHPHPGASRHSHKVPPHQFPTLTPNNTSSEPRWRLYVRLQSVNGITKWDIYY